MPGDWQPQILIQPLKHKFIAPVRLFFQCFDVRYMNVLDDAVKIDGTVGTFHANKTFDDLEAASATDTCDQA